MAYQESLIELEELFRRGYEACREKPATPNFQTQFQYHKHNPKESARPNFEVVV